MIYFILIISLLVYLIFLSRNIGERSNILIMDKSIITTIIILLIFIVMVFYNTSKISQHHEYDKILIKHQEIRNNISAIKKNIPKLKSRLESDPTYYQGWVMLAKSYLITDDLLSSSYAYEKAISLRSDDKIILEEYISSLINLDPKSHKEKILDTFEQILALDSTDINIYNMQLNYSININDSSLTRKILKNIIENPNISDKEQYVSALEEMEISIDNFELQIILSNKIYNKLKDITNLFFILKEFSEGPPFAVYRVKGINLKQKININANNKMIKDIPTPKKVNLYIKSSSKETVDTNLTEIYKSDSINLSKEQQYKID